MQMVGKFKIIAPLDIPEAQDKILKGLDLSVSDALDTVVPQNWSARLKGYTLDKSSPKLKHVSPVLPQKIKLRG